MSVTENGALICDHCGKFASWEDHDVYVRYGSPVDYEPPDPTYVCGRCASREEDRLIRQGRVPRVHWVEAKYERRARAALEEER